MWSSSNQANAAIAAVTAPIGSPFRMPVEFSVAAYRMGHSMIRNNYWVNFNFPNASLSRGIRIYPKSTIARLYQLGGGLQCFF